VVVVHACSLGGVSTIVTEMFTDFAAK
jgi:hypothetical protein